MSNAPEQDDEVGAEAAGPSPAALLAEAEKKRIRLESEVIREDWRQEDWSDEPSRAGKTVAMHHANVPRGPHKFVPLSARQLQVLELVIAGLTNQEIADRLSIGYRTVETHVGDIGKKLGARHRVEVVTLGMKYLRMLS